jgi:hypothetical protein
LRLLSAVQRSALERRIHEAFKRTLPVRFKSTHVYVTCVV